VSDFRKVSEAFWASPQIDLADLAEARERGFAMVINNRPEGESEDQTTGAAIEAAAHEAGMAYRAIPVTHAGFSEAQVREMAEALAAAGGPVLAYCRSGTRSTLLWALAEAMRGAAPETIARAAAGAGYDVASIRPLIDMLAGRQGSAAGGD
jgi:uncharacterized protein (TIGR01244 family)